jgi:hypothetical protein
MAKAHQRSSSAAGKKKTTKPAKAAPKRLVAGNKAQAKKTTPLVPLQQTVDDYISKVAPWQRTVIEKLRMLIRTTAPRASEALKFGQPVYDHKGPFSYIKAHAAQINFGFWRGDELDDPKHILQGEGARMRHVKITEAQPIDEAALGAFVVQAFKLNDKKGDPMRG